MKSPIFDGQIQYTLCLAEALTVAHTGTFEFEHLDGREAYAFVCVLEGTLEYRFESETRIFRQGQVIYLPKGVRYSGTYLPPAARTVLFQFDFHEQPDTPPYLEPVLLPAEALDSFRTANGHTYPFNAYLCAARIYELLSLLQQSRTALPQKFSRLLPALEALEHDPADASSVSFYAALCHMSVPGFRRNFKEYTGMSPVEYRNELRLTNARRLILSREYSVEAAARISGFSNLSFFYRLFRRKYGEPPGRL